MNKLLITRQTYTKESYLCALVDEKNRMLEVNLYPLLADPTEEIGTIVVGKVKNIAQNLNAAFVDIAKGKTCYLSLEHMETALFTHQARAGKLTEGDEVVVQIIKERIKSKFPIVSTKLSFPGSYMVLTNEKRGISYSSRLRESQKQNLENQVNAYRSKEYSLIVRTNAGIAALEDIMTELSALKAEYMTLRDTYMHRTCYSVLKSSKPFYVKELENIYADSLEEIVTDEADIYAALQPQYADKLRLYQNDAICLSALYSVNAQLEKALQERVWLKSGAYLVIQPTEAMIVIDVNSGKKTTGKNAQENYAKINTEAAKEIARQLRLRNLSGICIIDFINMESEEQRSRLMNEFKSFLREDPVPTQQIDITRLGLVEVTRKKGRRSLAEQIRDFL